MSDRARSTDAALRWLGPFAAVAGSALALLALTSWLEGTPAVGSGGLFMWLTRLDASAAVGTLSNAAEVVAAVLAIAITVSLIVVELAANRYTHRITQLFVREPTNALVMGFFVVTALYCMWISTTVGHDASGAPRVPFAGVVMAMGMVSVSLLLLLPYFAFVFSFLQPTNVVDRIRADSFQVVRRAARRGYRHGLREQAVTGIEQLEDVALNAMDHNDTGISMASVEALRRFLHDYQDVRGQLHDDWFAFDRSLTRDPDFVAMAPHVRDDLVRKKLWLEMKILRQYHTIFTSGLNRMRSIGYLVAVNTHRIASEALTGQRLELFDLCVRFFNSYLRAAVNSADVRTAYYTLNHYRLLAEEALAAGDGDRAIEIASHLRYYGQLAFAQRLPFVLEAVAYDMSLLNEAAFELGHPAAPMLLEIFLSVDKESDSEVQEISLRGVRRAQVQLATFFLARGDEASARLVFEDMQDERPERLASIRDELLAEESPDYWEVTDRGVNFAYLAPERRKQVLVFFDWFGSRVPRERRVAAGANQPPPES